MSEKLSPHIEEQSTIVGDTHNQNETEARDFILVDTPDQTDEILRFRASFISGLEAIKIDMDEIGLLIYRDNGYRDHHQQHLEIDKKYLGDESNLSTRSSKKQSYAQLYDRHLNNGYNKISYGVFIPSYVKELQAFKKDNPSEDHRSLLIGALTVDTVQEYQAAVQSVFSGAKSEVIDLKTRYLTDSGMVNVQTMDGLETSFESASFDTIHTNFLLSKLKEGQFNDVWKKKSIERLFTEMYRLLRPSGEIILVEGSLTEIYDLRRPFEEDLTNLLINAGFKDVKTDMAEIFSEPRGLDRFMRSSAGNFDPDLIREDHNPNKTFLITAKK